MSNNLDFGSIKMLLMDMDGVLTDGGIYLGHNGAQMRKFHAQDGQGIRYAQRAGLLLGIITGSGEEDIISTRASYLGIPEHLVSISTKDKLQITEHWAQKAGISLAQVAYIGDDVPDIAVMSVVGISACPADAVALVRESADVVLQRAGGQGCVREFIDGLLLAQNFKYS